MVFLLKLIDIFPQSFTFTYKGGKSLKTNWGGIISIFAFFALLINAFLIGNDIYYKENPNVIQITKEEKFTPTFRINKKTTNLGFSISDEIGNLDYESYLTITPLYRLLTMNKENKYIQRNYNLDIKKCKKNREDNFFYEDCIKDMDFYFTGSWSENSKAFLTLFAHKCSNETKSFIETNAKNDEEIKLLNDYEKNLNKFHQSDYIGDKKYNQELNLFEYLRKMEKNRKEKKIICKSPEKIDKFFSDQKVYFNLVFNKTDSDPKNSEKPLTNNQKVEYYRIGEGIQKQIQYYYSNYVSESDHGIVFEDIKIDENKLGISSVYKDYYSDKTNQILAIDIYMSKNVKLYIRSYIKLQVIFANFGGFINLIFLLCNLLSFPYFERVKKLKIINEFFDLYDEIEDNDSKSKNKNIEELREFGINNQDINDMNNRNNLNNLNNNTNRSFTNINNQLKKDLNLMEDLKGKKLFDKCEIIKSAY